MLRRGGHERPSYTCESPGRIVRNSKQQISTFENALSQHFGRIRPVPNESCAMNNFGQPAEPDRDFVELAILRMLEIAQRQGITAADFLQMLDSGMRVSDFLTAMGISTNAEGGFDCDC